ncbi:hypothetical protein COV13_04480 [Candidatus Woesearchaeota archaeon CG10_big_fil_rev_8_21_14_0_10_32_9]|nr:MAG: hypothetical protein COV13_04480 [Candidatus Woesearchaeota archaeon CG10_big_fil_rev_8_21_14_0_10_32_9]
MKKIYFQNSKGQILCGTQSDVGSDLIVIICHGLGASKDHVQYVSFQQELNEKGISTLRIDLLGHGESAGEYNDLTLTETIDDILSAKHELEKQGYTQIGFIGSSFGGVGGIMAASIEPFKFLTLISPPTYYDIHEMVKSSIYVLRELMKVNKKTTKNKAKINMKFFKDYGSHDSYAAAEKILEPVLIIHGDEDKIVPLVKSIELHKRIKNSKMKILKGADHHYTDAQERLTKEIVNFAKEQYKENKT